MDAVFGLFGTSIGVLFCFLGGLMAVDMAPKNAAGAALGVAGIASYLGAGIQDIVNGHGRRKPRAASVAVFLNALLASCAQAGTTSDANAAVFAMQARPSGVE